MARYEPNIPRIDDSVPRSRLHELCQAVAVPNFDWINQPIIAVIDGVTHIAGSGTRPPRP
jgi:hypothetical protein